MNRFFALKILRLVISAGLIFLLIVRLDLGQIVKHLKGISVVPLLLAAAMDLLMIAANSLRWKILLRARAMTFSVTRLLYYYLVGIFFSAFLPTSVGGDFARVVAVSSATQRRADAFASVIVERLLGFSVLFPLVLVSLLFVARQLRDWKLILSVEIAGMLIFAGAIVILLRPVAKRISKIMKPFLDLLGRFRARERLQKAYDAIVIYKDSKRAICVGLGLSVVSRLLWVCSCYLIGRAFSLELSFAALLLVVPVVELIRMIPISISGVGVREVAFVAMLRQFGVEENLGFAFSVVVYAVFFVFSLVGGLLYGTSQFARRRSDG